MTNRTPIAAYVRISKDTYGTGVSVANQLDAIQTWAGRMDYEVAEVFTDNDVSASNRKPRPAFERLLASDWTQAVVWHQDRLLRRPDDLERIISREPSLLVHQVQAGPLDLSTPSGQMQARIVAAVSLYEVEQKAERQKNAKLGDAKNGRYVGNCGRFGQRRDGTWVPGEAEAVQEAAKRIASRAVSFNGLAKEWNDAGFLTTRGGQWTKTTIRRYFQSSLLIGKQVYRGVTYDLGDYWKPLLDVDTYDQIQSLIQHPPKGGAKRVVQKYLLSGLLKCGVCGAGLTSRTGKYPQYQCPNPRAHVTILRAKTDEAVVHQALLLLNRREDVTRQVEDAQAKIAELSHQLRTEEKRHEEWMNDALASDTPASIITRKENVYQDRRAQMQAELGNLQVNAATPLFTEEGHGWADTSPAEQRNLIESVFESITVNRVKGARVFDPSRLEFQYTPFALDLKNKYEAERTELFTNLDEWADTWTDEDWEAWRNRTSDKSSGTV